MSLAQDILTQIKATVDALSITLNSTPVPSVIRKLPKREESVDPAVQITICPRTDLDTQTRWSFGGRLKVVYNFLIVIISPNNDDQLTNLDTYLAWREQIRLVFAQAPLGSVPIFTMQSGTGVFLDRQLISDRYDYQEIIVKVTTIETATG